LKNKEQMKKIILNYYLLAVLLVIAQAIFVVAQGNSSITYIKKIGAAEKEQARLEQKLNILESELAYLQSIENTRLTANLDNFVNIGARELISGKSLASATP
jgi:hypothetical protein